MYVIRRRNDGWYYTGDAVVPFSPDSQQAQTYLSPDSARLCTLNEVYQEEREPAGVSIPATLILATLSWVVLYYFIILLVWLRHHV
jgi:hypothetical protein